MSSANIRRFIIILCIASLALIIYEGLYLAQDTRCHSYSEGPSSSVEIKRYISGYTNMKNPGFMSFLHQRFLISPPPPNARYKAKESDNPHHSQRGQSEFVDKILKQKRNGFFVECGAADGLDLSNSIFFETERNWTGLLVEANPTFFRSLLERTRNAHIINACLSTTNATAVVEFLPDGIYGGIIEDRFEKEQQSNKESITISVSCFPLHALLNALNVNHVDYFSLDVEGAELKVLGTIPFDQLTIDVFSVEYGVFYGGKVRDAPTLVRLAEIRQFFKKVGNYREVGILPWNNTSGNVTLAEIEGLDVVFQRLNIKK